MHDQNSFITLTYDDAHLPCGQSLNIKDWQRFMKRLRRKIPKQIKFFACGEYGENRDVSTLSLLGRPHFHAILFGHQFTDLEQISTNHKGDPLYRSTALDSTWGKGLASVGQCTFASAAYVARYCTKKITGDEAEGHYTRTHPNGDITYVRPEFNTMSNGIGKTWWEKYKTDTHKDFLYGEGHKQKLPAYYDKLMADVDEDRAMKTIGRRRRSIDFNDPERFLDRLRVKEKIKLKRTETLKRNQI